MNDKKDITLADIHTALVAILGQLRRMEEKQDMREKAKGERNPPQVIFNEYTHAARDRVRETKKHIHNWPESNFE